MNDVLQHLRDVHPPAPPGLWPPAPGWWLLWCAALVAVALWAARRHARRARAAPYIAAERALTRLEHDALDAATQAQGIALLLRRLQLALGHAEPGADVVTAAETLLGPLSSDLRRALEDRFATTGAPAMPALWDELRTALRRAATIGAATAPARGNSTAASATDVPS